MLWELKGPSWGVFGAAQYLVGTEYLAQGGGASMYRVSKVAASDHISCWPLSYSILYTYISDLPQSSKPDLFDLRFMLPIWNVSRKQPHMSELILWRSTTACPV